VQFYTHVFEGSRRGIRLHGVVLSSNANAALCPTYLTFLLIKLVSEEKKSTVLYGCVCVLSVYVSTYTS
jgi:hypothetical protein